MSETVDAIGELVAFPQARRERLAPADFALRTRRRPRRGKVAGRLTVQYVAREELVRTLTLASTG